QIRVLIGKPCQLLIIMEVMYRFLVALSDLNQMLRPLIGSGVTVFKVNCEVPAFAPQAVSILIERLEQLQDFTEILLGQFLLVGHVSKRDLLSAELNQNSV